MVALSVGQKVSTEVPVCDANPFKPYPNTTCPCIDMGCSQTYPSHTCLTELEAGAFIKRCKKADDNLCRYGQSPACEWTGWIDIDDPSLKGDYEQAPEGCTFTEFEIRDRGTIFLFVRINFDIDA